MDKKLKSPSPFLKLMTRRVVESVNPATERLKTMDAILFQAKQSKQDLMFSLFLHKSLHTLSGD